MRPNNNDDGLLAVFVISAIGLAACTWYVANAIGADFFATGGALIKSLVALIVVYFLCARLSNLGFWSTVSGAAVSIWPLWWSVLDSIAIGKFSGGSNVSILAYQPDDFYLTPDDWYTTNFFQWSVETALLAVFCWCVYKTLSDR